MQESEVIQWAVEQNNVEMCISRSGDSFALNLPGSGLDDGHRGLRETNGGQKE